jgi:hypothetical protein
MAALEAAGQVVVRLGLHDAYDLGGQFFLWELAIAVAGSRLGINPFDQPNVESAKVRAREMVAAYAKTGSLPTERPALSGDGMTVFGDVKAAGPRQALEAFLGGAQPGAYVSLQAYLQPTPETDAALQALRVRLRDETRLAVTVGYGPRFLHSTGQLHKGDAGRGLFIQFSADDPKDAPIPDQAGKPASSISFGVLKTAQVLGDAQALRDAGPSTDSGPPHEATEGPSRAASRGGRRVVRFHLGADIPSWLRRLAA